MRSYNGILLLNKKEITMNIYWNVDELQKPYPEEKKPDTKEYILYDLIHVVFQNRKNNQSLQKGGRWLSPVRIGQNWCSRASRNDLPLQGGKVYFLQRFKNKNKINQQTGLFYHYILRSLNIISDKILLKTKLSWHPSPLLLSQWVLEMFCTYGRHTGSFGKAHQSVH